MTMIIEEADKAVIDFLNRILHADKDKMKIIKTTKTDRGWTAEAEVFEESGFIKSLGLPTRVQDRNIYTVTLDGNLEVISYEQVGRKGDME
ncbi:MAG: hypothetical protein M0Z58_08455 [Nitrospiraceae bacterium]|nr:hypothetical protein [Nitrospiraceae bacterium]